MIRTRAALTALTMSSSLVSFGAYSVLLKYMGASDRVDLLFFASSVPMSTAGIAVGVLYYLLPPRLIQMAALDQEALVRALASAVMGLACALALPVMFGGSIDRRWEYWSLLIGFMFTAGLTIASALVISLAQARGAYLLTGVGAFIASAGLLLGSIAAIQLSSIWLVMVGQLLGAAVAILVGSRTLGIRLFGLQRSDVRTAWVAVAPFRHSIITILIGTSAFTLFPVIDAAICLRLAEGSLTIMSYAQRVLVAVGTAISLGAYVIAAKTSADTFKTGGITALRAQAKRETLRLVAFGLLAWAIYRLLGYPALTLVFSTAALNEADLRQLSAVLSWMLFGSGPMAALPYLFRVYYSIGNHVRPAIIGAFVAPGYAALAWLMLPTFGIEALAMAYAMVWWAAVLVTPFWIEQAGGRDRPLKTT